MTHLLGHTEDGGDHERPNPNATKRKDGRTEMTRYRTQTSKKDNLESSFSDDMRKQSILWALFLHLFRSSTKTVLEGVKIADLAEECSGSDNA